MATILKNFAKGLENLNQEVVSDLQVETPYGRGYRNGEGVYYDFIHAAAVCVAEEKHEALQKKMRDFRSAFYKGSVYVGAGGFMNLSYIGAMKVGAAILFDINYLQKPFWDIVIKGLAEHEHPYEFCDFISGLESELKQKLSPLFNAVSFEGRPTLTPNLDGGNPRLLRMREDFNFWFKAGLGREPDLSWLGADYQHLHMMAKHDAIGAITMDVNDRKACSQLAGYFDDAHFRTVRYDDDGRQSESNLELQGVMASVLHISNIFIHIGKPGFSTGRTDWTYREHIDCSVEEARENLSLFSVPDSVVIDDEASESWDQVFLARW